MGQGPRHLSDGQRAPYEFNEAVELWARQWGRHGHIEFSAALGCWVVHLSKRADDPVLKAWREGTLEQAHEPTECVPLHKFDPETGRYRFVPLNEWGVSGIEELLDSGNTWSGRGVNSSLEDGVRKTRAHNERVREGMKEGARDAGRDWASSVRRTVFDLPMVMGVDIPVAENTDTGAVE